MNCSSCRVRGQRSKLSYRHAELGAVKVKKKKNKTLGMLKGLFTVFFMFFVLRKGKEKN